MKIKIIYFACLIPNAWEPIVLEQLDALKKLNLYSTASNIWMSVISNDNELSKLKLILSQNYNKIQLKNVFTENYYEYPGIKTLYQVAEDEDDTLLLYLHSKGMTSNQHEMRKYLFKNTLENYKEYINEFKKNKDLDIAGAIPHHTGFCYFNFFWTRSSYIRNYCSRPEISENRYIWEVWTGTEYSRKKQINTWSPIIGYATVSNQNEVWDLSKIKKIENPIIKLQTKENNDGFQETKSEPINNILIIKETNKTNKTNNIIESSIELEETKSDAIIEPNLEPVTELDSDILQTINKTLHTKHCILDLSYDNIDKQINSNYKKLFKLSTTKQSTRTSNIISCNKKLCSIKKLRNDITLKEFVYSYVYRNNDKINLIYCNLNNVDEILEDLLHHVFINKIKLLIKLPSTLDNKFNYLLSNFTYNLNWKTLNKPILLEPKTIADLQIVKKNMTVMIIGYNQYTYISNMVNQLKELTNDIVIIDNNSTFEPLLDYYSNEYNYTLLKMDSNIGHKVYESKFVPNIFGDLFIITDPDLEFNSKLPKTILSDFIKISNQYKAGRVGMAIEIDSSEIRSELTYANIPIKTWEGQFWRNKIKDAKYQLYNAAIDTTFCLLNTKYNKFGLSIRVAGNYVCKHLPWYYNFHTKLLEGEYDSYLVNNVSSNFFKLEDSKTISEKEKVLNKVQEKVTDKVQEKVLNKVQEKVLNKVQEKVLEKVQEKVTDKVQEKVLNKEKDKLNYDWIKTKLKSKTKADCLIIGKNYLFDDFKDLFKRTFIVNNENGVTFSDIKYFKNKLVQKKTSSHDMTIKELFYQIINSNLNVNLKFVSFNNDIDSDYLEDLLYMGIVLKLTIHIRGAISEKYNYLLEQYICTKNNNTNDANDEILLEPNTNIVKDVFKKNMTAVIISFNQYTYVSKMVKQLEKYTNDIVVIDNNSTFPKLLDYYKNEYKYSLIKMDTNYGHKVYDKSIFNKIFGDIYILTDPDLEFNKNLPDNFISELINISNYFQAEKVGFALLIDSLDIRQDVKAFDKSIVDWEKQYWTYKLYYPNHEIYNAALDTTFCLINKQNKGGHYRVAGNYTCKHLPWHEKFEKELVRGEYEYYLKNNVSTNYWKK